MSIISPKRTTAQVKEKLDQLKSTLKTHVSPHPVPDNLIIETASAIVNERVKDFILQFLTDWHTDNLAELQSILNTQDAITSTKEEPKKAIIKSKTR